MGPPCHQGRVAALSDSYYNRPEDYVTPMGYYDITGVDFEDFPAEWANYYEYEPEEEYYGPTEEWKPACSKRESCQSHTDKYVLQRPTPMGLELLTSWHLTRILWEKPVTKNNTGYTY